MSAYKCVRCGTISYHLLQTPTGLMHKSCWAREQAEAAAEGEREALNVAPPAKADLAWLTVQDLVVGFDEQLGLPVLVVDPQAGFSSGLIPKARYVLTREAAAEVGAMLLAASIDPKETQRLVQEALVQRVLAKEGS